ncbi:ABC transporter permease [Mucilaginibacter terrae]|uniref:ABC transporter permease n=1 Tax=Mucilaginibacter terrae TaxID=1955052 RepID=UPI003638B8BF
MLANHIKIAFRSLWRNRAFSVINMLGLVLGFAVFILITEYVAFEWSGNRFHQNFKQLYRVSFLYKDGRSNYYMPPGLGPFAKASTPGIKQYVRVAEGVGSGVITVDDAAGIKTFREDMVSFTDNNFFKVFTFPVLQGSGLLNQPKTVAVSQSVAKKYFGKSNVIGKVLQVNNQFGNTAYTITTVFKDMPQNSDIQANVLLSFSTLESEAGRNGNDWADPAGLGAEFTYLYILANEGVSVKQLENQSTQLLHRLKPDTKTDKVGFQPLANLHLAPGFNYSFQTFGSLLLVVSFLSVAVLIIIIAWVNYINLSTAQALNRAKDVGVRKVLGANRWQLTLQYFTETFVLTLLSLIVALVLVMLVQNVYNNFLEIELSLSILNQGLFWLAAFTLILAGTLLAGGYVAWVLSSFNPLKTIRSKALLTIGGLSLRRSLVVFQFVTSIVFIIATIVLYQQLQFMQNQDLGMKVDQRIVITGPSVINSSQIKNSLAFENQLRQLPYVKKLAASNNIPGQGYNFSTAGITNMNPSVGDDKKSYAMLIVDDQFFSTYDISFLHGSTFTNAVLAQGWGKAKKVILNESAVKQLGYTNTNAVIGQKIKWESDYEIVGVVKDYHHLGLHEQIKPMIFLPAVADGYFTIKTDGSNMPDKVEAIRKLYQKIFPGDPFSYSFLDEAYDRQYKTEYKLGRIFIAAAFTAVFIACLGLLGLAMFTARQRIKEIGIRKILGANLLSLINLISADFLKLVIIALIIASPVAWYIMHSWLQGFAYRITIQWWMFALAGALALFIAFATVSIQAIKAASVNPVKSLRSE